MFLADTFLPKEVPKVTKALTYCNQRYDSMLPPCQFSKRSIL